MKIYLCVNTYFIDFSKVLNQSKAGSDIQKKLGEKFQSEATRFNSLQETIKKEENDLISQKKVLSTEEYQKKINDLRIKVSDLQKKREQSLNSIAKSRNDAKKILLDTVNPIIKKYMEDNNIRIIVDKQSVILGDTKLEITDKIIELLNKEISSIKLN